VVDGTTKPDEPAGAHALTRQELLRRLLPETLKAFEAIQLKSFRPRGVTLFSVGQAPSGIFLVHTGKVKLLVADEKNKKLGSRTARSGEVLGLAATVSGEPYEVTAETTTPAEVGFVRREDFLGFLRDHADAAFLVVRCLSHDLRATFERVRSFPRIR
jgi:CRP/FNR family transcriptional regulator